MTNILQKLASAAGIVKVVVSILLLGIEIVLPSSFEHIQLTDAEISSKFAPDTIVFILSLNNVSEEYYTICVCLSLSKSSLIATPTLNGPSMSPLSFSIVCMFSTFTLEYELSDVVKIF